MRVFTNCPRCGTTNISMRPLTLLFPQIDVKQYVCNECKYEWS